MFYLASTDLLAPEQVCCLLQCTVGMFWVGAGWWLGAVWVWVGAQWAGLHCTAASPDTAPLHLTAAQLSFG